MRLDGFWKKTILQVKSPPFACAKVVVVVWLCGCVVVWLCGCVVVWLCGCVVVWLWVVVGGCVWRAVFFLEVKSPPFAACAKVVGACVASKSQASKPSHPCACIARAHTRAHTHQTKKSVWLVAGCVFSLSQKPPVCMFEGGGCLCSIKRQASKPSHPVAGTARAHTRACTRTQTKKKKKVCKRGAFDMQTGGF